VAARSKARKSALDVLFEADQRGANVTWVLEERLKDSGRQVSLPPYAETLVRGVVEHWIEINAQLAAASQEWTVDRMPAVDRAILRVAAWEILYNESVTTAVAIDEAVELARDLSTEDSPRFVNGVLGGIARDAAATE
jgi:transcription antitermination protein NusB